MHDNFIIIYELLDEMMNGNFPQTTISQVLWEWAGYSSVNPFIQFLFNSLNKVNQYLDASVCLSFIL